MKYKFVDPTGMYILGCLFGLMFLLLILVQSSVQYTISKKAITPLPAKKVSNKVYEHDRKCLIVIDDDETSLKAKKMHEDVLGALRVDYEFCSADDFNEQKLKGHKKLILIAADYTNIAEYVEDIKNWVDEGNDLLVGYVPEATNRFKVLNSLFGIESSGEFAFISGIHFNKTFAIGSEKGDYKLSDVEGFRSCLDVTLTDDCTVYLSSIDKERTPLIWKRAEGDGTVVVHNFTFFDKAYRGILCLSFSLLGDSCVYPVINGSAFYIDDFPAPAPEGNATYIKRDYNMSNNDFFQQVWWTDIYNLIVKYNIKATGFVIETYSDQTKGEFLRNNDTVKIKYFGNMLLRSGGEIGIHGYNHMPLVLKDFDYRGEYDGYEKWRSPQDMKNAVDEVISFTHFLFEDNNVNVYVPPSNILSKEGRAILKQDSIKTIASVYLGGSGIAFEQEFDVSDDGMVNTPRISSGYLIDDYMQLAAMAELNLHMVNTHFIHPDDVIDDERGAAVGWKEMYRELCKYMDWLQKSCPQIRRLTGTELSAAVQRYDQLDVKSYTSGNKMDIYVGNFIDEAWVLVRLNNGQKIDHVDGGECDRAADGLYILRCKKDKVQITFKDQK